MTVGWALRMTGGRGTQYDGWVERSIQKIGGDMSKFRRLALSTLLATIALLARPRRAGEETGSDTESPPLRELPGEKQARASEQVRE